MYEELKIIRGLKNVPNDVFAASSNLGLSTQDLNAETGLLSIDLMNATMGFSIDTIPYDFPQPTLEGGGIWTDSVLSNGRELITANDGNVTETFDVTVSGNGSRALLYERMTTLNWLRKMAIAFHTDFTVFDPVYIKVKMLDEPGPRYALIYSMDIAYDQPDATGLDSVDCTISIEREPFYTPLAPGENPKLWAFDRRSETPTAPFDYDLIGNASSSLIYERVSNRYESKDPIDGVTPGVDDYYSKNYIDISADKVPGDADALLQMSLLHENAGQASPVKLSGVLAAVSSMPTEVFNRDKVYQDVATDQPLFYSNHTLLNASDDSVMTTTANDTGGVIGSGVAGTTAQRGVFNPAAATPLTIIATWDGGTFGGLTYERGVGINPLLNRYAFFARVRKGGNSTDFTIRLSLRLNSSTTYAPYWRGEEITVPDVQSFQWTGAVTSNTDYWNLLYLGTNQIGPYDNAIGSPNGLGWANDGRTLWIDLWATSDNGTNDLYVCDLFILPLDQGAIDFEVPDDETDFAENVLADLFYDNTGYALHGRRSQRASNVIESTVSGANATCIQDLVEMRGGELTLRPRMLNRLHVLSYYRETVSSTVYLYSAAQEYQDIGLNIVPRWRAIRDV